MGRPPGGRGRSGVGPAPGPGCSAGTLSLVTAPEARRFGLWLPGFCGPGRPLCRLRRHSPCPWAWGIFCTHKRRGFRRGLRPRTPGHFLLVQKVPKNTPAPFGLDPRPFVQLVSIGLDTGQPLKLPNPSGIRSAAGFSTMLRPLALLKGYANLLVLCRTACGCGNCSGSRQQKHAKSLSPRGPAERKTETTFSTRGDSRSAAEHRTAYEVSGGQKEIQWQLGISYEAVRLGKRGGLGSPQRLLVTFVRTKVTWGVGPGRPRRSASQPEGRQPKCGRAPHRLRGIRRSKGNSVATGYLL